LWRAGRRCEPARAIAGGELEPTLVDACARRRAPDIGHRAQVVALKVGGSRRLGHPRSRALRPWRRGTEVPPGTPNAHLSCCPTRRDFTNLATRCSVLS